jgi:FlaA1/EpsC-like NDP-sugar epimerase
MPWHDIVFPFPFLIPIVVTRSKSIIITSFFFSKAPLRMYIHESVVKYLTFFGLRSGFFYIDFTSSNFEILLILSICALLLFRLLWFYSPAARELDRKMYLISFDLCFVSVTASQWYIKVRHLSEARRKGKKEKKIGSRILRFETKHQDKYVEAKQNMRNRSLSLSLFSPHKYRDDGIDYMA